MQVGIAVNLLCVETEAMEKELTSHDIIHTLKAEKSFLCEEYGVTEIGLFGSYANGTPNESSDIDLLVELKEPRFDYVAGLMIFLEHRFKKKVEIVVKSKSIKSKFIQRVENTVIYV